MMYTEAGKTTIVQLWEETMNELDFASVRDIIDSMGKKALGT